MNAVKTGIRILTLSTVQRVWRGKEMRAVAPNATRLPLVNMAAPPSLPPTSDLKGALVGGVFVRDQKQAAEEQL